MLHDLRTNQLALLILQWHNDCVDNHEKNINYKSYAMGLRFEDLKN